MHGNAQCDDRPLGRSNLPSYFLTFLDQCTRACHNCYEYIVVGGSVQRHFLTDDMLSRCEDIRDKGTKLQNFKREGPQNLEPHILCAYLDTLRR